MLYFWSLYHISDGFSPHNTRHNNVVLIKFSQDLPRFCTALDTPSGNSSDNGNALTLSMPLVRFSWELPSPVSECLHIKNTKWSTMVGPYHGVQNVVDGHWDMASGNGRFSSFLFYSLWISIQHYFKTTTMPPIIKGIFNHYLTKTKILNANGHDLSAGIVAFQ